MQNRIYKIKTKNLSRCQSSQRLKFKQIPITQDFNELQSKYEIYNHGTPNIYSDNLEMLKAKNIKEQIAMVNLPDLDRFITQINQSQKQKLINQRNYDMYPTLLKQNGNKFKDILSQKQEIKDFILWFQQQFQNIEKNSRSFSKKFEDKQTLIAAGFTEMANSIAKFSKNRSQIIKMLWNRQQFEVKEIIQGLNSQNIKIEKELLQQISSVHNQYQQRIEELVKENKQFDDKLKKETTFTYICVDNLRILRKRIKKLEYAGKKLAESNNVRKKQNLHLMEQNIKLLTDIRQISEEQAVVLNYRKLQIHSLKQQIKHNHHKSLVQLTRENEEDTRTPFIDFQRKKNSLREYFQQRIKQNPDQKVLIKEDYFVEDDQCPKSIDQYFKNVINRPNIQMELLNQPQNLPLTKEKAVNTDILQQTEKQASSLLTLDKAIQVQLIDGSSSLANRLSSRRVEARVYQLIDEKEQEKKEKQSKKRIIQHRISRKNSLTLLQLQNFKEINHNLLQKRHQGVSYFKKEQLDFAQSKLQDSKISSLNSQNGHSDKQSELSDQFILQTIPHQAQLTAIKFTSPSIQRKSHNFSQFIKSIKSNSIKVQQHKKLFKHELNIIKFEGEIHQELKQSQLEDLISKHLQGNYAVPSQNPQKSLNKILITLYRNVWQKVKINYLIEFMQVVKNSYGNIKSVIWKFLNAVSLIHSNQNSNSVLKIVSILLKINKGYSNYSPVNTQEVAELYFQMFWMLTIKNINDTAFNLWKCCTTFQKVRGLEFAAILQIFFSEKKRKYIDHKINEFIAVSQSECHSKNSSKNSSNKRIQIVSQESQIIKLHPLILYIIEVYLIQKQLYYNSYSAMAQFIATDGLISAQMFLWLLQFLGFDEDKQIQIVNFAFAQKQKQRLSKTLEPVKYEKYIKIEMLYRCCVKFDFPILQEIFVSTHQNFKRLPIEIQKNYYKMIGIEQWLSIKQELLRKYESSSKGFDYFDAFKLISDKLEEQIRKGSSIFRQFGEVDKIKRSEQIFSFFYKILILSAHNSLLQNEKEDQLQKSAFSSIK